MLIWNLCQCSTVWKQTCYVSLVCLGASRKKSKTEKDKKTLSTFVSLFAFVLLLSVFSLTRTRVVQLFKKKRICLHAMNATQILYINIYIYMKNTVLLYHVLKWHQKEASTTSTWFCTWWSEMPNKLRVPNSSASRYEYSIIIINHCHLSECKWKHSVTFVTSCTVGGNDSANTIEFLLALSFLFSISMYFALIRQWSSISCMSSTQISLIQNCPKRLVFCFLILITVLNWTC